MQTSQSTQEEVVKKQNNLRRLGNGSGESEMMEGVVGANAGQRQVLERKEGGECLGMRDVLLLVGILRHNEGCEEDAGKTKLPAGIEGTALSWDAKLVNEAQKHGVRVVGVGNGLAHDQHSPQYNRNREDHMVQQLMGLKQQDYNLITQVGEAHIQGLQALLRAIEAIENGTKRYANLGH